MNTMTTLGIWFSRLVFAIAAAAIVWATAGAAMSAPVTAPAVRWGRVVAEQVVTAVLG